MHRLGDILILRRRQRECLLNIGQHTRTAVFIGLNLAAFLAGVLAASTHLEGYGRMCDCVWAFGNQGIHRFSVFYLYIVLCILALVEGGTIDHDGLHNGREAAFLRHHLSFLKDSVERLAYLSSIPPATLVNALSRRRGSFFPFAVALLRIPAQAIGLK